MPKIPIPTAQRGPGVLQLPTADPRSFGVQAGEATTEFGQQLQKLGEKIQDQQDETDVIDKSTAYKEFLSTLPDAILNNDTIKPEERVKEYRVQADQKREELVKESSSTVQRVFSNHAKQLLSEGVIHMQTADIETRIKTARVALSEQVDQFADLKATALAQGDLIGYNTALATSNDLLQRAEQRGTINPIERQAAEKARTNRMFEQLAEQNSMLVVEMTDAVKAGKPGDYYGMDKGKATYYGNLAYNAIHQKELALQHVDARKEKERELLAESTKQDYVERSVLVENGKRVFSTESLLQEAARSRAVGKHKDETVKYLESKLAHEQEQARNPMPVDWKFYNEKVLSRIWAGGFKDEHELLQFGADKLGGQMDNAITAFQNYRTTVSASTAQDYKFGHEYVNKLLGPLPGQTIDPLGQKEVAARATDRYNTWYASLVERAKTEGPQAFKGIDVQAKAREIANQEYQTMQDNLIRILDVKEASLQYKSEAEVKQAHKDQKISIREANMHLAQIEEYEYMKALAAKKTPTTPTTGGRIEKK